LLADPDTQPKSEQSILIEGERIKAVSGGFIDPPPGGELIDLRKKFVLPGLIDCHVHLTTQLDREYRLRKVEDSDPKVGFNAAHNAAVTLGAGFTTVRDVGAAGNPEIIFALRAAVLDLRRHLVASGKTIPTILITAYPNDSVRERALRDGVVCYLSKPFDENDLLSCIRSSLSI
jgi:imidazolonepropionase-like amidohydrolase